jgi:signal transduction histidine kinase
MLFISNNSLKHVLTVVFLIAVLLLALLVAMLASRQAVVHLKNDAISDTYRLAERLAKDSRLAIIQMASENVTPSVQIALDLPNIESVTIYELNGVPLVGHRTPEVDFNDIVKTDFRDKKAILLKETAHNIFILSPVLIVSTVVNKGILDFEDDIAQNEELIGFVLVTMNKSQLHKAREKVWLESLFVITLITAFFVVVLMHILGKITTPIRALADFMTHPDTAVHYKKAPVDGVKELREISSAFNSLMQALEQSNNELLLSNEELEVRVSDLKSARDKVDKYNKENRALITGMNHTLEEERKFIARELHDHLNADLLFIKLKLSILKATCKNQQPQILLSNSGDDVSNTISEMIERITNIYDSSRNIVRMLRPEVIDSLGLIGAIEDRIDLFASSQPGCRIELAHEGDFTNLNYNFSITIYRIIQESLTNAGKHADASEIKIRLSLQDLTHPTEILLDIIDNGRGFDTTEPVKNGIGLISMRERAYALGGKLTVESTPGEGTRVIANIPLDF